MNHPFAGFLANYRRSPLSLSGHSAILKTMLHRHFFRTTEIYSVVAQNLKTLGHPILQQAVAKLDEG